MVVLVVVAVAVAVVEVVVAVDVAVVAVGQARHLRVADDLRGEQRLSDRLDERRLVRLEGGGRRLGRGAARPGEHLGGGDALGFERGEAAREDGLA